MRTLAATILIITLISTSSLYAQDVQRNAISKKQTSNPGESSHTPEPDREKEVRIKNSLKEIALATLNFESAHRKLPARHTVDENNQPMLSWRVHLLPFMDENDLYEKFHLDEPWDSPHNITLLDEIPDVFQIESGSNQTRLKVISDRLGVLAIPAKSGTTYASTALHHLKNGTSNTVLAVYDEVGPPVYWSAPIDKRIGKKPLKQIASDGTAIIAMVDGSVQQITQETLDENEFFTFLLPERGRRDPSKTNDFRRPAIPQVTVPTQIVPEQFLPPIRPGGSGAPPTAPRYQSAAPVALSVFPDVSTAPTLATGEWSSGAALMAGPTTATPYQAINIKQANRIVQLTRQAAISEDEAKREEYLSELQQVLEAQFDARMKTQGEELKQLEQKVTKLKAAYDRRQQNRDRVIQNYVDRIRMNAEGLSLPMQTAAPLAPIPQLIREPSAFGLQPGNRPSPAPVSRRPSR